MNGIELPPGVALRDLDRLDLSRVIEIERASFSTPWQHGTFMGLLRRGDADLIAATVDGVLAGYAITWSILDQAELGNVAVAPEARQRGLGRLLVLQALERVRGRGVKECFLEVRESNGVARRLYEEVGFVSIGRRRKYYSSPVEDALVMRIAL